MLSDFHERLEVLKKGKSLEGYYLESNKLEEEDTLQEYGIINIWGRGIAKRALNLFFSFYIQRRSLKVMPLSLSKRIIFGL